MFETLWTDYLIVVKYPAQFVMQYVSSEFPSKNELFYIIFYSDIKLIRYTALYSRLVTGNAEPDKDIHLYVFTLCIGTTR